MKRLLLALALCTAAVPASAATDADWCDGLTERQCELTRANADRLCNERHGFWHPLANAKCTLDYMRKVGDAIRAENSIKRRELVEETKRRDRDAEWVKHCKPQIVTDKDGIGRYTYAHKGCEQGKIP